MLRAGRDAGYADNAEANGYVGRRIQWRSFIFTPVLECREGAAGRRKEWPGVQKEEGVVVYKKNWRLLIPSEICSSAPVTSSRRATLFPLFSLFPTCLSSQWLQVAQSIKISSPMMSPTPRQRPRRRSWSKTAGSVIWIGTPSTSLLISSSPVRLLCPSSPTDLSPRSIVNQLRPLSKLTQRYRPLTVRPPDPPIPDTS